VSPVPQHGTPAGEAFLAVRRLARDTGADVQELLTLYALEGLLTRVAKDVAAVLERAREIAMIDVGDGRREPMEPDPPDMGTRRSLTPRCRWSMGSSGSWGPGKKRRPGVEDATAHTSHLLAATVQFLVEMVVVEVTAPTLTRTRDRQLYDVPLLTF
jgi:hypothetical protein